MFLHSAIITAIVMIIIGTANIFGMVVSFEQLGLILESISTNFGMYGFLLFINIIFLILGTFMDQNPIIIIMAPIFAPIAMKLGIDPIHFGMIVVINVVLGLLTPPMGPLLFITGAIGDVSFEDISREIIPFLLVEISVLALITYVPTLSLFIPRLFGYTPG